MSECSHKLNVGDDCMMCYYINRIAELEKERAENAKHYTSLLKCHDAQAIRDMLDEMPTQEFMASHGIVWAIETSKIRAYADKLEQE
jgi:hypothetical protein